MDKSSIQKYNDVILELLFPSFCFGCNKEGTYLCQDCKATLEISEYNYCLCNKNPIRLAPDHHSNGKCQRCQDHKLSGLYSALPYKEKSLTRKLIHNFKYEPYVKDLAETCAGIVVEHLVLAKNNTEAIWENSVLVPVPLGKSKLKSRDYNQAGALADELSQVLKVPVARDELVKIRETAEQMKLSAKARQENLLNAFAIKNPAQIAGKKVFLVDDVYTTGSTMAECARILKEAKSTQVWGIVIAREG
ncbi:MAG: hypothetical protein A3A98_00550 [Candidatus Staskawiczbacteria bacterium RIFCSPLOWO2_01_FULL_40_39]|uniref:Phosphoribosyltransferase domain-containing protein n=1 Tax=Candidatus Staskawiczbacteria bacterium RIFCSPHIGHO2_01_FULL_39_25 TaxID=1802202 RepID=A0A1G2HMN9_9BACT|nr:MAG: hypothetical protein A2730_00550 [Candidatus Staskawiczbacteria bacterium RIFCSPHIGHO2_01_FULL_39_25]OGZ73224.1 MAG: hypothetical protein A3A98_00550 [Candidatus Staskawiczbacteria bacterium RIFCSPLOWO2_01_FULL_40_39]OGZ76401.1 MAG: hypothetical protein A3I87_01765 [Candidatus Staskawiczbacteria bacterium RIFCSPLOWO2_02_FULL_39_8]